MCPPQVGYEVEVELQRGLPYTLRWAGGQTAAISLLPGQVPCTAHWLRSDTKVVLF